METGGTWWLTTLNMDVHQRGIGKLTSWYDRRFNCGCIYVEKQCDSNTITFELLLLELRLRKPKYMQRKLIFWPTLKIMRHLYYNTATWLAVEILPALLKGHSTVFLYLKSLPIQVIHQLKTATATLCLNIYLQQCITQTVYIYRHSLCHRSINTVKHFFL